MKKITLTEELIYFFSKLPGLGNRSARRIVLHLLEDKDLRLRSMIDFLEKAFDKIQKCILCGNIDCDNICNICSSKERNNEIITIVETVSELWALERGNVFNGKYHVIGRSFDNSNEINSENLGLNNLLDRCKKYKTKELIIATNSTLEGQTVAYFISEYFKEYPIKISRLAIGVPIGGELDYLDEGTLSVALECRRKFD